MQKLLFGWIAMLFTCHVNGQVKSVTVSENSDTTYYYPMQRERIAQMGMRDPLVSKDSILIRVSSENWSVEVTSKDLQTFGGRQYFFTKPIGSTTDKELFKMKSMTEPQAKAIYQAFREKSVVSIPSARDIRGWPLVADGTCYLIEHGTSSAYSLKAYPNPSSARYRLKEGAVIDDFAKTIEAELQLANSLLAFLDQLPAGTYRTGGITAYTNKAQRRKSRK